MKLTKVPDPSPPLKIADEKREKKNKYVQNSTKNVTSQAKVKVESKPVLVEASTSPAEIDIDGLLAAAKAANNSD